MILRKGKVESEILAYTDAQVLDLSITYAKLNSK